MSDDRVVSALREIASFAGAPCSFDLCNRPTTLAECVDMLTCHVCCAVAIARDALAGMPDAALRDAAHYVVYGPIRHAIDAYVDENAQPVMAEQFAALKQAVDAL